MHRSKNKAEALAAALGGCAEVADYADVASGRVQGDVLMNSTSIGMHPVEDQSPVDAAALGGYRAVFDAVYTPLETRLLKVGTPLETRLLKVGAPRKRRPSCTCGGSPIGSATTGSRRLAWCDCLAVQHWLGRQCCKAVCVPGHGCACAKADPQSIVLLGAVMRAQARGLSFMRWL